MHMIAANNDDKTSLRMRKALQVLAAQKALLKRLPGRLASSAYPVHLQVHPKAMPMYATSM